MAISTSFDGAVVMFFQFRSHVLCRRKVKFDTVSTSRKYDIVHNHLQCCDLFKLFSINHVRESSSCLCNDIESCDHNFFHCPLYFKQCLNKQDSYLMFTSRLIFNCMEARTSIEILISEFVFNSGTY